MEKEKIINTLKILQALDSFNDHIYNVLEDNEEAEFIRRDPVTGDYEKIDIFALLFKGNDKNTKSYFDETERAGSELFEYLLDDLGILEEYKKDMDLSSGINQIFSTTDVALQYKILMDVVADHKS
ncbi:hypothetical protein H6A64_06630 [Lacrimispora saccharolytica]|nr:hypothetical protein [Lacrimispora saccharolytica]